MLALGNRCVICGRTECLTFDCIRPMGHSHHCMNGNQRLRFYYRQWRAGNLQVLCAECNTRKSNGPMPPYVYPGVKLAGLRAR